MVKSRRNICKLNIYGTHVWLGTLVAADLRIGMLVHGAVESLLRIGPLTSLSRKADDSGFLAGLIGSLEGKLWTRHDHITGVTIFDTYHLTCLSAFTASAIIQSNDSSPSRKS